MSLIALLSLSPAPAAAAVATRPPKIVELHQRRTTFQSSSRRNSLVTSLKPQHTHLRLQASNKKTRYRSSFAAGFSLDAPERVDRLLALNDATSRRKSSSSSSTSSVTSDVVPELLLAPETDLFASQSSNLGLFMNGLRFLPPSTWRKQSDGGASIASSSSSFATTATSSSSDTNNNISNSSVAPLSITSRRAKAPLASPAKPSLRPHEPEHTDRPMALHLRRQAPARDDAKPTVCVPTRIRRVVWSKSPTSMRHKHQSERQRVARAANAKLSTSLMAKKLTHESHAATAGGGGQSHRSFPVSDASDVSYVIDEDALAHRFYHELESTESIATTTSNVSTPPPSPMRNIDDRERAWRAQQLALERQVAALQAETQAKDALVQYLMDANARLVSDCVCRVSRALSVSSATEASAAPVDTNACASDGRAQRSSSSDQDRAAPEPTNANNKPSLAVPTTPNDNVPATTDASSVVLTVHRKLQETTTECSSDDSRKSFAVVDNAAAFDGLVQEIRAEFSLLFPLERRA